MIPPVSNVKWTDSEGVVHDLKTEKRVTPNTAASRLSFNRQTIWRMIKRKDLFPVLRHNARRIEVYECALTDYIARKLAAKR